MKDGVLVMRTGGDLVSAPPSFREEAGLPYLSGKDGVYIEFEISLSDSDPEHYPGLWLMPVKKNFYQEDVTGDDPVKYERWMELDVDEGGFGPGLTSTIHNWWGRYPNFVHLQNPNNVRSKTLDRSQRHRFGASYDPVTLTVCRWIDDEFQMSAAAPYVPKVAREQVFYLLMGVYTHHGKQEKEYTMSFYAFGRTDRRTVQRSDSASRL